MIAEQESPDLDDSFWNLTGENLENGEYQKITSSFCCNGSQEMRKHPESELRLHTSHLGLFSGLGPSIHEMALYFKGTYMKVLLEGSNNRHLGDDSM